MECLTSDESALCIIGKLAGDRVKGVVDHIIRLQELVQRLQHLKIDNIEYAYLRALVLFSTGMLMSTCPSTENKRKLQVSSDFRYVHVHMLLCSVIGLSKLTV